MLFSFYPEIKDIIMSITKRISTTRSIQKTSSASNIMLAKAIIESINRPNRR
jgi:hypothetical protein